MKRIIYILILLLTVNVFSLEIVRQKNVATYITVPLIDSTTHTAFKSSATGLDSELDAWADGSAPNGFVDCTNEATEIGTDGIYYLSLTQAEMNNDYIFIQIKGSDIDTQGLLIRTIVGDPLNLATTDDGGTINVTSGAVDAVTALTNKTDFSILTADKNTLVDLIWDELLSGHALVGSTGAGLSAAGAAGDPWSTLLPGSYLAGTAGYLVGTTVPSINTYTNGAKDSGEYNGIEKIIIATMGSN